MMKWLDRKVDLADPKTAAILDEASYWSSCFGRLLLDNLPSVLYRNVLDVGCGSGFPLFELAHRFGKKCRVTGVDVWPLAVERALEKRRTFGLDNVEVIKADAGNMPFDDGRFDLIVSNVGLNNFESADAAIKECGRVLQDGGDLILTTNLFGHMSAFYRVFEEVLDELNLAHLCTALQKQEEHRWRLDKLKSWLHEHGFTTMQIVRDEFEWRYADGAAFFGHPLTYFGFLDGWRSVIPRDQQQLVFGTLEKRLNTKAISESGLRFAVPAAYLHAKKS